MTVLFDFADHVATITLNRPEKLNAFNEKMTREIAAAWQQVRDDDSIHVAVLRAAGDRAFCTGIDVTEGPWWSGQNEWNQEDPGVMLGPKQHRVWKPVITAVHGMAAGGAMYFINESDIVICSDDLHLVKCTGCQNMPPSFISATVHQSSSLALPVVGVPDDLERRELCTTRLAGGFRPR